MKLSTDRIAITIIAIFGTTIFWLIAKAQDNPLSFFEIAMSFLTIAIFYTAMDIHKKLYG